MRKVIENSHLVTEAYQQRSSSNNHGKKRVNEGKVLRKTRGRWMMMKEMSLCCYRGSKLKKTDSISIAFISFLLACDKDRERIGRVGETIDVVLLNKALVVILLTFEQSNNLINRWTTMQFSPHNGLHPDRNETKINKPEKRFLGPSSTIRRSSLHRFPMTSPTAGNVMMYIQTDLDIGTKRTMETCRIDGIQAAMLCFPLLTKRWNHSEE